MQIAFTGHRPDKLGGYAHNPTHDYVNKKLTEWVSRFPTATFITGMALGVDQMAARVCEQLKVPFIAAVPFLGQENTWDEASRKEYDRLLMVAKEVVFVCKPGYSPEKLHARNRWMVDRADMLIAVHDGSPGGTLSCMDYARKKRLDIITIQPNGWKSAATSAKR